MILYFTNRKMNILGIASTALPQGLSLIYDNKTEDIDTGVAVFECEVAFNDENVKLCEDCCEVGNYILRKNDDENEFYTIIDFEKDTKEQKIYIYAEDAGLDLLNEVVGAYAADKAYSIEYYVNKFSYDSGFEIGINEVPSLTRKLTWEGEATAAERIRSVATQFDNCEISYSFNIDNLQITHKYINIYKKRGKDEGIQLRLNKEIDRIITKKSIKDLATALEVTGGTPENAENPITLKGYSYDDGDIYISGTRLLSRTALEKWSRYIWAKEPNQINNVGHIVRQYSYDTTSQKELCSRAVTELKKIREIEVNYEVDISIMPSNVKIGDTVNIIDDKGELYLSTRLLKLERSICDNEYKATLGDFLIKESGISQKVIELAEQFAKEAQSAKRALEIAKAAQVKADNALTQAESALTGSNEALTKAEEAQSVANTATQSATEATQKANAADTAVKEIESKVESIEESVENAKKAAQNAETAANTAKQDAATAKTNANEAVTNANEAKEAATNANAKADEAITKSDDAITTAGAAKTTAEEASGIAAGAKQDAVQAQKDIDALGESLTTLESTMQADYARKTDLTEAQAALQTQITQNAQEISSTAKQVQTIDETANSAKELANSASSTAANAQEKANAATAAANEAQTIADEAKEAATAAQANANNAQAAATNAQNVAAKAESDLAKAKEDLETVQSRVDATEEEITEAQTKVNEAQEAADKAKQDAAAAIENASNAQSVADTAAQNATNAQEVANTAKTNAELAQKVANEAKAEATDAKTNAAQAAETAANAQEVANTAKTNATNAQTKANEAATAAANAQSAADEANAKAVQAQTDLDAAKENLEKVEGDLSSTQEEVEAAKAAVVEAQNAADKAQEDATAAQNTADTAKANAASAQTAADNAQTAADNAQKAADDAQAAADKAQEDANALKVRMTTAETNITQNAKEIALRATKEEVTETLGGYYTKEEVNAELTVKASEISSSVKSTYTTKEEFKNLEIGGRNLLYGNGLIEIHSNNTDLYPITCELTEENGISFYRVKRTDSSLSPTTLSIFNSILKETFNYGEMVGQQVTLSLKARASRDIQATFMSYAYSGDNQTQFNKANETITTEWKTYYVTVDSFPEIEDGGGVRWLPYMFTLKEEEFNSFFLDLRDWKFEKGNKATDWTPATEELANAEDTEHQFKDTNDSLDAAIERITTAETLIQQLSDSISMLVTDSNGTSLMTQTSTGWTFNIAGLQEAVDTASQGLGELKESLGSTDSVVNELNKTIADLQETAEYMHIDVYEDEPCIKLGESDSNFRLLITNTRIMFMEGEELLTYINNKGLVTKDIEVENEIKQGGFVWQIHGGGNLGLVWKGESE